MKILLYALLIASAIAVLFYRTPRERTEAPAPVGYPGYRFTYNDEEW